MLGEFSGDLTHFEAMLVDKSFEFLTAQSCAEALALQAAHPRCIALAIVDLTLPGGLGTAVAVQLQSSEPEMKFLFISGTSMSDWPEDAADDLAQLRFGNWDVIPNRFCDKSCVENVRRILAGLTNVRGAMRSARCRSEDCVWPAWIKMALLDQKHDAVMVWNWNGPITFWNPGAERLYGFSRLEAVGQSIHELLSTRTPAGVNSLLGVVEREGEWKGELEHRTRDGNAILVETRMVLVREAKRTYVLQTNRDGGLRKSRERLEALVRERTDELKHANELLRAAGIVGDISDKEKLEEKLRQAQRLEAIGQLAGGVAHDFNNLLTIISGYSELLLSKLPKNDPISSQIELIRDAGSRAASLTRQLLAFSRKSVLEPKVLDLNVVVAETEKMLCRLIGEDIVLSVALDRQIGRVKVDAAQVGQVLLNVAVNARDVMPHGGRLTIETGNVILDESYLATHPEALLGRHVMLAITDSGSGMTPEVRSHIFEPFFTTKGVGKGTGLGLATVHGIVKQSGGHIEVYSEPGIGTTFKIYFPTVDEPIPEPDENGPGINLHGTEAVLLVEDDGGVRSFATRILQDYGYRVLSAPDGPAALQIVEEQQGRIDLLATDVVMPGMSGRELAETLQRKAPRMKALYVSGYTDEAVVLHGILHADVAFLHKPYTALSFLKMIRRTLDRH